MTIEVSAAEYDRLISRLEGVGFLLDCIGTAMEGNSNKKLGKGLEIIRFILLDTAAQFISMTEKEVIK